MAAVEDLRQRLAELKSERRMLMEMYGRRGEKHHMASMIGGLNPGAQRLHRVRNEIRQIEKQLRGPIPTVRKSSLYRKGSYGLSHELEYRGYKAKAGTDNFGKWYLIVDGNIVAEGLQTITKARDAFAEWVDER